MATGNTGPKKLELLKSRGEGGIEFVGDEYELGGAKLCVSMCRVVYNRVRLTLSGEIVIGAAGEGSGEVSGVVCQVCASAHVSRGCGKEEETSSGVGWSRTSELDYARYILALLSWSCARRSLIRPSHPNQHILHLPPLPLNLLGARWTRPPIVDQPNLTIGGCAEVSPRGVAVDNTSRVEFGEACASTANQLG